MAGLVSGWLGPAPEDKEYPAFFPVGLVGGCLRPAPVTEEIACFSPFFLSFWRVLFGSLKGTGTPVLGRQGGGTGERVPGTGT